MLKFISSLKLAVFLIAAIAVISILATLFPAADAFHSWTFRLLVVAFFINLATCTVKLLPGLWKQLHRSAGQVPEQGAYTGYEADEAELTVWLKEQHYKVSRVEENGQIKTVENPQMKYQLSYVRTFDMFAQTKHVETLTCLTRVNHNI